MKGKQTKFHTFTVHAPKILLSALILSFFVTSCAQLENQGTSVENQGTPGESPKSPDSDYCTLTLSLSVDESALRSIIPSYKLEELYYKFGYINETADSIFEFPESGGLGADYDTITTKQFQLQTGTYMFSLTAYPDSSCAQGTQVLEYDSAAIPLGAGSTSLDFPLAPPDFSGDAAKGSVSATFSFPVLADIATVTTKLVPISSLTTTKDTKTFKPDESDGAMTVTYSISNISNGTYILLLTFKDNFGKETVIPERITVVTNGTSTPSDSTGIVNLSEKVTAKYRCYVKSTGNDTTGTGTFDAPYKTIEGAIAGINAYDMADKNWSIIVNGTLTGTSTISSVKASSLTIEGYTRDSTSDVLNGNNNGSVLTISSVGIPVSLKNLTITGGNGSSEGFGGGLYLSNSDVRLSDGVIVTGNTVTKNGGGIYNNGTLYIYGSAIVGNEVLSGLIIDSTSANTALNGGGISNSGTIYMGYSGTNTDGTLIANPFTGRISGNYAGNQGGGINNTGTIFANSGAITGNASMTHGGGIYNSAGNIYLSGSAVVGTLSATEVPASGSVLEKVTGAGGNVSSAVGSTGEGGGIYSYGGKIYLGYKDADTPDNSFTGGVCGNLSNKAAGGISLTGKDSENVFAELFMHGGNVSYNRSSDGAGAIKTAQNAVITMTGGTITGNRAGGAGGAVYIGGAESFYMTGGVISDNETSATSNGGGVHSNGGTFSIGGTAYIPAGESGKNLVRLATAAARISLASPLTAATRLVATIVPYAYTEKSEILTLDTGASTTVAAGCAKFAIVDNNTSDTTYWIIDSDGNLASRN